MYSPAWPSAHVVSILLGVSYGKMCLYVTKMQGVEVERDRKDLLSLFGGLQVHATSYVALPVHTLVLPVYNCWVAEVREMDHRCE